MVNWRLQKWLKEISITKVVGERYKSGDIKNYKSGRIYYKSGDFITKVVEPITKVVTYYKSGIYYKSGCNRRCGPGDANELCQG